MEYFKGIEKMMDEQLHITADKREIKDSPKFAYRLLFARRYTPLLKYEGYLLYILCLKVRREQLIEKFQLKGYIGEICELEFGYNKVISHA